MTGRQSDVANSTRCAKLTLIQNAAKVGNPPLSTEGAATLPSPSLAKCLEHTVEDLGFFTF